MLALPCLIMMQFHRFPFWSHLLCADGVNGTCMSKWSVFDVCCRIPYKLTLLWHLVAALSRNIGVNWLTTCSFQKEQFFVLNYFHKGFFCILIIFFGAFTFKLSIESDHYFSKWLFWPQKKKRQYFFIDLSADNHYEQWFEIYFRAKMYPPVLERFFFCYKA